MIPLFFLRPFAQSVTPPLPASDGLQAAMVILEPIWGFGAGLLVLLLILVKRILIKSNQ
jgi:hypothetical protein